MRQQHSHAHTQADTHEASLCMDADRERERATRKESRVSRVPAHVGDGNARQQEEEERWKIMEIRSRVWVVDSCITGTLLYPLSSRPLDSPPHAAHAWTVLLLGCLLFAGIFLLLAWNVTDDGVSSVGRNAAAHPLLMHAASDLIVRPFLDHASLLNCITERERERLL